jgi:hypothetical protein
MSGTLTVNGTALDEDSVGIKIDSTVIQDSFRQPLARIERWTIVGAIKSDGSSGALNAKIAIIEGLFNASGAHYGDSSYTANGHTHTLDDSVAVSGVQVKAFGWMSGPWKMRTELSNRRSYYAVLQAEFRYNTGLAAYREEVLQIGTTGPRWIFMPSLIGLPQYQTLQIATTSKYVQRGTFLHRTGLIAPNASMFGEVNTHQDQTRTSVTGPQQLLKTGSGTLREMYMTQWTYFAESSLPLVLPPFNVPVL